MALPSDGPVTTRRLSHSSMMPRSRRSTLRLSVLDISLDLDLGVLTDGTRPEVAEWVFGQSASVTQDPPKGGKSVTALRAVVLQLNQKNVFGFGRFKKGKEEYFRSERRKGGLPKGFKKGGRTSRSSTGRFTQVTGLVRKVSSYVRSESTSSEKEEASNATPVKGLRQTIKSIVTLPAMLPRVYSTRSTDANVEPYASMPPTPFILMTQMDMSGIAASNLEGPRTEESSYLVVSQDNAVLDVFSLAEAQEEVAESPLRPPLRRSKRTFFNTARLHGACQWTSRGAARRTASDGSVSLGPGHSPAAREALGIRRGRDVPFPVRPIMRGSMDSVSVYSEERC